MAHTKSFSFLVAVALIAGPCQGVLSESNFSAEASVREASPSVDVATHSLAFYRDAVQARLPRLRGELRSRMTQAQRDLEETIDYSVVLDGSLNSVAFIDADKQRHVFLYAGLVQFTHWLAWATLLTRPGAFPQQAGRDSRPEAAVYEECWREYMAFLLDGIDNKRFLPGGPIAPADGYPDAFMLAHPDVCPSPAKGSESFDLGPLQVGRNDFATYWVDVNVKFTLGHELAHHFLGHVEKKAKSKEEARQQETQADLFALRLLGTDVLAAGLEPVLFAATEDFSVDGEAGRDHPAGLRRLKIYAEAMAEVLREPELRDALHKDDLLQFNSVVESWLKEAADEGSERWFLSMVSSPQARDQAVLRLRDLPSDHLGAYMGAGYSISSVGQSKGITAFALTKGLYGKQVYELIEEGEEPFFGNYVKKHWDAGYEITDLVGDKQRKVWLVVMSQGSGLGVQAYETQFTAFPAEYIQRNWNKGKYITALSKNGANFGVVMSEVPGYSSQAYKFSPKGLPEDFIKAKWGQGYFVTTVLQCEGDSWYVVMSKTNKWTAQEDYFEEKGLVGQAFFDELKKKNANLLLLH